MKKRISLLVIASCALLSFSLGSHTAGAWWNEPGPNHKSIPTWPPGWYKHHQGYQATELATEAEAGTEADTVDPVMVPIPTNDWWNEPGPNH